MFICFVVDITDLVRLLRVLKDNHFPDNRWDDLGLQLGFIQTELETIKEDKQDSKDCLKECLSRWLQQDYDTTQYSLPTFGSLAAALRVMGKKAVASSVTPNLTMIPAQHGQFLLVYYCSIIIILYSAIREKEKRNSYS